MQCVHPILSPNGWVPCLHCIACRMSYSREWSTRLLHEASYHRKSCFITLTYSDENLPQNGSLDKSELQRFIKRLRFALGDQKIKYFACGEYGDDSDRPHYHAIILGWRPDLKDLKLATIKNGKKIFSSKFLCSVWSLGNNSVGSVTYDSCRYVVDYIMKKYNGQTAKEVYGDRVVPFRICSNGIGKRYAQDNQVRLKENLADTVRGVPIGLPRYYRKVLDIPTEDLAAKAIERQEKREEARRKKFGDDVLKYAFAELADRRQRELNLEARKSLKRKGKF